MFLNMFDYINVLTVLKKMVYLPHTHVKINFCNVRNIYYILHRIYCANYVKSLSSLYRIYQIGTEKYLQVGCWWPISAKRRSICSIVKCLLTYVILGRVLLRTEIHVIVQQVHIIHLSQGYFQRNLATCHTSSVTKGTDGRSDRPM